MVLEELRSLGAYDGYRLSSVKNAIVTLDEETLNTLWTGWSSAAAL